MDVATADLVEETTGRKYADAGRVVSTAAQTAAKAKILTIRIVTLDVFRFSICKYILLQCTIGLDL